MEKDEITSIFNEIARDLYSTQEEKHRKKQLYDMDVYCCSQSEVESFIAMFEEMLDNEENMDRDLFTKIFSGEGSE